MLPTLKHPPSQPALPRHQRTPQASHAAATPTPRSLAAATKGWAGKRRRTNEDGNSEKNGHSESILAKLTNTPVLAQTMPFLASKPFLRVVIAKGTSKMAFETKSDPKLGQNQNCAFLNPPNLTKSDR